jgi:hypothetical protein
MSDSGMTGAPAGVSEDLQQFTKFKPSGKDGALIMHTCAAIFNILKAQNHASVGAALSGSESQSVSVQLNLTDPAGLSSGSVKAFNGYLSPIFDLIGSAFVKYRVRKLIFHYEPQASATDGQRMVFAFAADPLHPVLWNSTLPDQNDLLALADSIAFMPWRGWSMNVSSKVSKNEFYTFSDASTTVTEFVERFSDFGVISCLTDSVNQASDLAGGVLYMETEIELMEFCPITATRPSSLLRLKDKAEKHAARKGSNPGGRPRWESGASSETPKTAVGTTSETLADVDPGLLLAIKKMIQDGQQTTTGV